MVDIQGRGTAALLTEQDNDGKGRVVERERVSTTTVEEGVSRRGTKSANLLKLVTLVTANERIAQLKLDAHSLNDC